MVTTSSPAAKEKWRFTQLGGFDQVEITQTQDLLALPNLDQKLWAALSCPTKGLYFDTQTLSLLDTDQDGRIRAYEVINAVKWISRVLKNPAELFQNSDTLPLAAINDQDEEGRQLLDSAKHILKSLGKADAVAISIADLADINKIFADTQFNGDGVIPVKAATNDTLQQAIKDIIGCCGSVEDRCGDPGLNTDLIKQFFEESQAYVDWWNRSGVEALQIAAKITNTQTAVQLLAQLRAKIDDYFTRCQLAEFDDRAGGLLNPNDKDYEQLAGINLSASREELANLPLAAIAAGQDLPLKHGINPAWRETIDQLHKQILNPLFGELESLSFQQWQSVTSQFTDYLAWLADKPATVVESLGLERLQTLLKSNTQTQLIDIIAMDLALKPEAEAIGSVVRLVHYYRDLYTLLKNFVSFRDFYQAQPQAIFQAGTLYLDGRSCQLCVHIDDIAKHSELASLSKIYLAYCECRRPGDTAVITIAAAITGGDSDNLRVGRNGVFYDRSGLDWDATIVKIIENPISIREAFWSPYKRIARTINEQLEKGAAARDKAAHENAAKGLTDAGGKAEAGKPPAVPFDIGKFVGIFAAIGLAVGAIGTALASLLGSFMGLLWWQMPLAILGVMLLISGPSMFLAYLKLRQRNLAPVLDACGWAINAKAFINIPFGRLLTGVAKLPENAERQLTDPFGEKKSHWKRYLLLIALLAGGGYAWYHGYIGPKPVTPPEAAKPAEKVDAAKPATAAPAKADAPTAVPAAPAAPEAATPSK